MSEDRKLAITNALGLVTQARSNLEEQSRDQNLLEDHNYLELDAILLSLGLKDLSFDFEVPWNPLRLSTRLEAIEARLRADGDPKASAKTASLVLERAKQAIRNHQEMATNAIRTRAFFFPLLVSFLIIGLPLALLITFVYQDFPDLLHDVFGGKKQKSRTRIRDVSRRIQLVLMSLIPPILFLVGFVGSLGFGPLAGIDLSQILIMSAGLEFLLIMVLQITASMYFTYQIRISETILVDLETAISAIGVDCGAPLKPHMECTPEVISKRVEIIENKFK